MKNKAVVSLNLDLKSESMMSFFGEILLSSLPDPSSIGTINEYVLDASLSDREMQERTKSMPMHLHKFLLLFHHLVIKPEEGIENFSHEIEASDARGYLFHVAHSSDTVFTYCLSYYSGSWVWKLTCYEFNTQNGPVGNGSGHGHTWSYLS